MHKVTHLTSHIIFLIAKHFTHPVSYYTFIAIFIFQQQLQTIAQWDFKKKYVITVVDLIKNKQEGNERGECFLFSVSYHTYVKTMSGSLESIKFCS